MLLFYILCFCCLVAETFKLFKLSNKLEVFGIMNGASKSFCFTIEGLGIYMRIKTTFVLEPNVKT